MPRFLQKFVPAALVISSMILHTASLPVLAAERNQADVLGISDSLYKVEASDARAFCRHLSDIADKARLGFIASCTPDIVAQDVLKHFVKMSFEQKRMDALYLLGMTFYEGKVVRQDYEEAFKWFHQAAERGQLKAQYMSGLMWYKGEKKIVFGDSDANAKFAYALSEFQRAADKGEPESQFYVGLMYIKGDGVKKDVSEGIKWYRKSAEQGHMLAQKSLGFMYYLGDGVAKDEVEAAKWLLLAAEQGHPRAQFSIGLMYHGGVGVETNKAEALKWFRKAAAQGVEEAKKYISAEVAENTNRDKRVNTQSLTDKEQNRKAKINSYIHNTILPMCDTVGEAAACGYNTSVEKAKNIIIHLLKNADKERSGFTDDNHVSLVYQIDKSACEQSIDMSYDVQLTKNKDCKVILKEIRNILKQESSPSSKKAKSKISKQG
jgi:TPR repeat protein